MAKQYYNEVADEDDKKRYDRFTAEDEELILVTGFGQIYLRHQGLFYFLFPGVVFMLMGLGVAYFSGGNLWWGLGLGVLVAILFAWMKIWLMDISNKYLLTTRRVLIKRGFFTVKLATALYDKITHIEVEQGFVDRAFLNHGKVIVHTAGADKGELVLNFIEAPIQFKNLLERLINREREQYGRQTGAVVSVEGELVE